MRLSELGILQPDYNLVNSLDTPSTLCSSCVQHRTSCAAVVSQLPASQPGAKVLACLPADLQATQFIHEYGAVVFLHERLHTKIVLQPQHQQHVQRKSTGDDK